MNRVLKKFLSGIFGLIFGLSIMAILYGAAFLFAWMFGIGTGSEAEAMLLVVILGIIFMIATAPKGDDEWP